ncbi:MAG: aldose 1-epimerase [Flavobacteriaceae bacterium]|nr:aldose 1-epimerase [Flavobacteriaceae bacterium]
MSKITLEKNGAKAIINSEQGATLEYLELRNTIIIQPLKIPYGKSFASAIMFPFVNRVQDSTYKFKNNTFQLQKTQGFKTAIHGLIYNKRFKLINDSENKSEVSLYYESKGDAEGFPFKYRIEVKYKLTHSNLTLNLKVENIDQEEFPFSIGWHPYFFVGDLKKTSLKLNSTSKLAVDGEMMPTHIEPFEWYDFRSLDNTSYDDTFKTEAEEIDLKTDRYQLKISSQPACEYIQLFIPPEREFVAIEPMTAPANAFNNKIGLKTLQPEEEFKMEWKLELM